jgi:hypothetical protein
MLKELEAIFNQISASHSSKEWSFKYSQQSDTIALLEALRERLAEDKKLIEYWQNKINRENEEQNRCE